MHTANHHPLTASASHDLPHKGPGEDPGTGEEGLELPVNPDQGTPLIPEEDGSVEVPA